MQRVNTIATPRLGGEGGHVGGVVSEPSYRAATTAHWHLSIDIDILDPDICPGVTSPLPQGWPSNRLLSECKELFEARAPDSVSLVEVTSEDARTIAHAVLIKEELDTLYEVHCALCH